VAYIELVEEAQAPPEVRAAYEESEATRGFVMETWKAIAHNPAIFAAYLGYIRAVFGPGELDQRTKDLVAVRCSHLNQCQYSLSHRVSASRHQGIDDEDLEALVDPTSANFTAAELAALAFATELTLGPQTIAYADNAQAVSAETLAAVKGHYTDAAISELAITVALWNGLNRYHRVMDFELDMPPPPGALDVS
jgi:uncharacterized peroxidase-related enzyme